MYVCPLSKSFPLYSLRVHPPPRAMTICIYTFTTIFPLFIRLFVCSFILSICSLPSSFAVGSPELLGKFKNGRLVGSFDREGYRTNREILFAWSTSSSSQADPTNPMAYEYVLKAEVPSGAVLDVDRQSHGSQPQKCISHTNGYFTPVKTTCLKGNCNMPSLMYIGRHNGEV